MSDTEYDVVIAAYMDPDLAQKEFDGLVKLLEDKQLEVEGVALVTNDADGNTTVQETGDHLGRKHLRGRFARHKIEHELKDKMGGALPAGMAGIVAVYDRSQTRTVDATLAGTAKKSVAQVDGPGAKKFKAALAEAQTGLTG